MDDFSLGSTMSQYIEVTIPDGTLLIEEKEILLQIGMDVLWPYRIRSNGILYCRETKESGQSILHLRLTTV